MSTYGEFLSGECRHADELLITSSNRRFGGNGVVGAGPNTVTSRKVKENKRRGSLRCRSSRVTPALPSIGCDEVAPVTYADSACDTPNGKSPGRYHLVGAGSVFTILSIYNQDLLPLLALDLILVLPQPLV